MNINETYFEKIIKFNKTLENFSVELPDGFEIINPFNGKQSESVWKVVETFYSKFYNDTNKRHIILGSSPARCGSAVIGIPFEDAKHLEQETGICIDHFKINKSSSNFLFEVIERYGGFSEFYKNFYMNFVCPLGITRINEKGRKVNCNYYENRELQNALEPFILNSLQTQLNFELEKSTCICIGSGENYSFLEKLNNKYNLFKKIISLEHPRYIMQYNSNRKDEYIDKYLLALNDTKGGQNGTI